MFNEKEYGLLLKYAKNIIGSKYLPFDEYDLVNEVFVRIKEYNFLVYKKAINGIFYEELSLVSSSPVNISESMSVTHFRCRICEEIKPASCFRITQRGTHQFFRTECKDCQNNNARSYRKKWYEKNRQSIIDRNKKNYRKNSIRRRDYANKKHQTEEYKQYRKEWREKNKEKIRAYNRMWYKKRIGKALIKNSA